MSKEKKQPREKKQPKERKIKFKKKNKLNITLSNKTQKILLYVGGFIMIVVAYTMVFTQVQAANETLQSDVNKLQVKRQEMKKMVEEEQNNQAAIAEMEDEIADMLAQFPEDVREEDIIMYADSLEQVTNLDVYKAEFTPKNMLWAPNTDEGAAQVDYAYYLYSTPVTYSFTVGYQDMKAVIAAIQNHGDLKNVESVILTYDPDTGLLEGTIVMNSYSIEGGTRGYDTPQTPEMSVGTNNPFNTIQ